MKTTENRHYKHHPARKIAYLEEDFAVINEALEEHGAHAGVTPAMMIAVAPFESEPGRLILLPREWFKPYAWWRHPGGAFEEVVRLFALVDPHDPANKVFFEACRRASCKIVGPMTPAQVVFLVRDQLENVHPPA